MPKFNELTIVDLKNETDDAVSIAFEIPDHLKEDYKYLPGQYITLKKTINNEELRRAYSICSSPGSNELRVAVKAVQNGTFSTFANSKLKKGDMLEISFPEGQFTLKTSTVNANNYLGISAGSGITPVISMVKAVLEDEPKSTFTLIYGNKSPKDTIFKEELDQLAKKYLSRFNLQYVYSRSQEEHALFGRIDQSAINFVLKNKLKHVDFEKAFLCGPESMIETAKATLLSNNFSASDILFELFTTPVSSDETPIVAFDGTTSVTVLLDDEEESFTMNAKETILTAALKNGIDAPYSCQGGICSSCMAKLTDGSAVMDKNTILTDEEVNDGYILTCQAHPTSQKITVDYDDV